MGKDAYVDVSANISYHSPSCLFGLSTEQLRVKIQDE